MVHTTSDSLRMAWAELDEYLVAFPYTLREDLSVHEIEVKDDPEIEGQMRMDYEVDD